jgi:UDP-glucose 4-epimerase
VVGNLLDKKEINQVIGRGRFDAVIHFAAYAQAGESMKDPAKYLENNIQGGLNLLEAMVKNKVDKIVFSSTCAIYGYPERLPVTEEEEKKPVSVYGESKLAFERILGWYDQLLGIKSVCLRYFNACGAALGGEIGEDHQPETHIIPVALGVALGQREKFILNGIDYQTSDGTCVRDYVHVVDLAAVHLQAVDYLRARGESNFFNVGTGQGYSNKEIIAMVKRVTGKDFEIEIGSRRAGDPAMIYADKTKVEKVLAWRARYSDLGTIIGTAWQWHKSHPDGFGNKREGGEQK